jgi:DNA-binding Lrp family transcriptional regulator
MSLDKLDLMLMEALEDDARQPVQALARKLGVKRTTVRYRLNRLRAERILTIACVSDTELLGYQFPLLIGINVSPGKTGIVADQLGPLPAVKGIFLTVGHYDILTLALARDRSALVHFVSQDMADIPDITSIEMMHLYQSVKDTWRYFKPQTETVRKYPKDKPSELDLSIVKAMQLDPRQTITKLAGTVGCSNSVAKTRLEKLVNDGVIRFVSIIDTTALGYNIGVVILVKAKPDKVCAVANELSVQDTARYVSLITGQWQIFFGAVFRDSKHMYSFLSGKLTRIPGIIEYEVVHIVNTLKYSVGFTGLPVVSKYPDEGHADNN